MKKMTVSIGLAVALALPVGALAKPHPNHADKRAAKAECKTLRGNTDATREAFLTTFRNFGACVSKKSVEEAVEGQNAHTNAAKVCKTERGTTPAEHQAFAELYGTNENDRNAFGKCVSKIAKAKEKAADEQDAQEATEFKNAAKECDSERGDTDAERQAFAELYGTNANHRNAFGKCVSRKAKENHEEESAPVS